MTRRSAEPSRDGYLGTGGSADFSGLDASALDVFEDRRAVTVTLPRARLLGPRVDPARSRVFERERGLVDRIGSVFEDNPTSERELFCSPSASWRPRRAIRGRG